MPRVLTLHRTTIPLRDRERYLERLNARREHYRANGCNFWAFEETGLRGAFLEFTEAGDQLTLAAAQRTCPERIGDESRVYQEVELG